MLKTKSFFSAGRFFLSTCGLLFALLFTVTSCKKEDLNDLDYMVVQLDKGEDWSIINAKGEVVAKEEYSKDSKVSIIRDGVYWVKSEDGYNLYNVSNPKKPVVKDTYDFATEFYDGRAFVAKKGEPILVIDGKGSQVAKLGDNIQEVTRHICDGYAVYYDGDKDRYGVIDVNGKIVIEAAYAACQPIGEGLFLVKNKADDEKLSVIDKSGNVKGEISTTKYGFASSLPRVSEGLIPVVRLDADDREVTYITPEGEKAFTVKKSSAASNSSYSNTDVNAFFFNDGYAVFRDKEGKYGIIDKKGEIVLRAKYDELVATGDGKFLAKKEDKCGVVDKEGNTVLKFDYDAVLPMRLGGNYVVLDGKLGSVITPEGKEAFKKDFVDVSWFICDYSIAYVNVSKLVSKLVKDVTPSKYGSFGPNTPASAVAKTIEGITPERYSGRSYVSDNIKVAPGMTATVVYGFSNDAVDVKSHVVRESNGWYSYDRTVIDGYSWSSAPLISVLLSFNASSNDIDQSQLEKELLSAIKAKGFKDVGGSDYSTTLAASDGGVNTTVTVRFTGSGAVEIAYEFVDAPVSAAEVDGGDVSDSGNSAAESTTASAPGDDYSWLSTRLATASDVSGKSKAEIRIMRNYIFARHGYKFKDKSLQDHFSKYSWYEAKYSDVTSQLNSIEQKNIAFLKARE